MPKSKESVMRRILIALGITPKGPSIKELNARADAVVAKRKARRAHRMEHATAGAA